MQTINTGTVANDFTGDPLKTAMGKINANFEEIQVYQGTPIVEKKLDTAVVEKLNYSITPFVSTVDVSESIINIGNNNTRWNNDPFLASGKLTKVVINNTSTREGVAVLKVLSTANSFNYTVEQEVEVNLIAGINTFTDSDLGDIDVEEGQFLSIYCDYVLYGYKDATTNGASVPGELVGTSEGNMFNSVEIGLYYEITEVIPLKQKVEQNITNIAENSLDIEAIKPLVKRGNNVIFDEKFDVAIPNYFTNSGIFTLGESGLDSPVVTGYNKDIFFNKKTSLDTNKVYAYITLNDINTKIGIGLKGAEFGSGRLVEFDFENKSINTYHFAPDYTKLLTSQTPITFNPVEGRKYLLISEKNTAVNTNFKLVDLTTSESIAANIVNTGSGVNGAFISAISGSFTVNRFRFVTNEPINSIAQITGDSFIEGSTVADYGIENRYAAKIKAKLNGGLVIAGQGGEYAYGLMSHMDTDFDRFVPKYHILAIGTNDTLFEQYVESMTTLINRVVSLGGIPVLVTVTRRLDSDNLILIRLINQWVKESVHIYVDIAKCMSVNNDGETQDADLFLPDQIHPNVAGHEKIYQQFLIDVPEIFDTQI